MALPRRWPLRAGEAGELGKHVPIVAVTAFGVLSDEGKFKRAGMNYFLPKPVNLNKLREVLLDVIRKERHVVRSLKMSSVGQPTFSQASMDARPTRPGRSKSLTACETE